MLLARLDDQLHLLTTGSRMAVPRQQTLRAAIEWSYALLSEAGNVVLTRVSRQLHAGGSSSASTAGAGRRCWICTGLVDKSLVSLVGAGETATGCSSQPGVAPGAGGRSAATP